MHALFECTLSSVWRGHCQLAAVRHGEPQCFRALAEILRQSEQVLRVMTALCRC